MDPDLILSAVDQIKSLDFSKSVVLFSGGKDSLVVMDLAKKAGLDHAIYINSELEFSISRRYVEEMRENYNIEYIKPKVDFFEFCRRISPPSKRLKWCCKVLKLALSMDYAIKTGKFYHLTGIRADESERRSKYEIVNADPFISANPRFKFFQVNPILCWSEEDVWDYIKENKLKYNPIYKFGVNRVGCWCCPFTTRAEWELSREIEKKGVQKLKKIISEFSMNLPIEYRRKYCKNGWKSFAFKYHKKTVIELQHDGNTIILKGDDYHLDKVEDLLFIVSSNYCRSTRQISFKKDVDLQKQQIRMLLEKALNCVGCGVCLVICPVNALYLEDGIKVDQSRCVGCLSCCKRINSKLKMGCIARNYKIRRLTIEFD